MTFQTTDVLAEVVGIRGQETSPSTVIDQIVVADQDQNLAEDEKETPKTIAVE